MIISTFDKCIKAFQVDCVNRADQSSTFIDNMQVEVIEPLKKLLKKQEMYLNNYGGKFDKLKQDVNTVNNIILNRKEKYISSLDEAETTLYECESARVNNRTLDMLNVKVWNTLMNLKEDKGKYANCQKLLSEIKSQYDNTVAEVLNELQNHEEQRVQATKDSLQKLLVYEVSMEQNHRYDIQQITNALEKLDDVLVEELTNGKGNYDLDNLPQIEMKISKWDRLFEVFDIKYYGRRDAVDYDTIVEETKIHIIRVADMEYKESFDIFKELAKRTLGDYKDPDILKTELWKAQLNTAKGRLAFLDSFKGKISLGSYKLTQMAYKVIADLILHLINKVILYLQDRSTQRTVLMR